MSNDFENYRPKSPDLSGFVPPPPPPQRKQSFHPDPPRPNNYPFHHHRGSYDASPFFSPAVTTPSASYFGIQPHSAYETNATRFAQNDRYPTGQSSAAPLQSPHSYAPQPQYFPHQSAPTLDMPRPRRRNAASDDEDSDQTFQPNSLAQSRSSKKRKSELSSNGEQAMDMPQPSIASAQTVDVKTKFPVARIKRIMQADEDVGKVAQATPTAVSKALELFMIQLVQKGVAEARSRNSKKVSAGHLKNALMSDGQFDFLNEICQKVQDTSDKKGPRAKSEEDSDEVIAAVPKKGKGRARKKAEEEMSD